MTAKEPADEEEESLIYIGTLPTPNGGQQPWYVTKEIKTQMDAAPFQATTDMERAVLAGYLNLMNNSLESYTPGTPEYDKARKKLLTRLKKHIRKEQQEHGEV